MGYTQNKFSPSETRLLALLPADGDRIGTDELTKLFYNRRAKPYNARVVISNLVRNLEHKTKLARGAIRIKRSKASGPLSMQVWLEK